MNKGNLAQLFFNYGKALYYCGLFDDDEEYKNNYDSHYKKSIDLGHEFLKELDTLTDSDDNNE